MKRLTKGKKIKNRKKRHEFKMRYSFFTVILLLCLVHVGVSAFYNISKTINYKVKIRKMDQLKLQATQENIRLKEELENFNSLESLEAIARNNLKMAGDDEVLVIINKKAEPRPAPVDINKANKKSIFKKQFAPKKVD